MLSLDWMIGWKRRPWPSSVRLEVLSRRGMMVLVGTIVSVHEGLSGHFEAVTKRSEVAAALDG